jgi:hypothetical protein
MRQPHHQRRAGELATQTVPIPDGAPHLQSKSANRRNPRRRSASVTRSESKKNSAFGTAFAIERRVRNIERTGALSPRRPALRPQAWAEVPRSVTSPQSYGPGGSARADHQALLTLESIKPTWKPSSKAWRSGSFTTTLFIRAALCLCPSPREFRLDATTVSQGCLPTHSRPGSVARPSIVGTFFNGAAGVGRTLLIAHLDMSLGTRGRPLPAGRRIRWACRFQPRTDPGFPLRTDPGE